MNEAVKAFLEEKEAQKKSAEEKAYADEKKKILCKLGLCDKEYSPENVRDEEYTLAEWDENSYGNKYYKLVPYEVDEEEYEKVKAYYYANKKEKKVENNGKNGVASILRVIAIIIFVVGFITGIVFGADEAVGPMFISWVSAFVIGVGFFGFAEIIKLLTQIRDK